MRYLKYAIPFLILAPLYVLAQDPTPTPAVIPGEPADIEDTIGLLSAIITFFKSGQVLLAITAIINILIFVVKNYAKWLKIPAEWKVPIVAGLGLVITVLAKFITGAEWSIEWVFAFLSGPVAIFVHQLISRFKGDPAPPE